MPLQPCGAYKSPRGSGVEPELFARVSGQRKNKSVPCEQEMSRFVWGCRGSLGPELQPELQTPASSCRADMQEADGRGFLLLVFLLLGGSPVWKISVLLLLPRPLY